MERILCVNGDGRTLDALVSALRQAHPGATVDGERDATAALDRLTAASYDYLVCDEARTAGGNSLSGLVRVRHPDVSVLLRVGSVTDRGGSGATNVDPGRTVEVAVLSGTPSDRLLDAVRSVAPAVDDPAADGGPGAVASGVAGDAADDPAPGGHDPGDGWALVDTVDWARHDAPDVAVVLALDTAWGDASRSGPPATLLYDVLDGDALARLLQSAAGNGATVAVEFVFGTHEVRVGADGRIVARPITDAGKPPGD